MAPKELKTRVVRPVELAVGLWSDEDWVCPSCEMTNRQGSTWCTFCKWVVPMPTMELPGPGSSVIHRDNPERFPQKPAASPMNGLALGLAALSLIVILLGYYGLI